MSQQPTKGKRLIYMSRARTPLTPQALGMLNMYSRVRNAKSGITGLLMHHENIFMGVLEGPPQEVEACFARISRDERHGHVRQMVGMTIKNRSFEWWKMSIKDPKKVPTTLRRGMFELAELFPKESPLRGDDPAVRAIVRKYLAGFPSLTKNQSARADG